MAQLSAKANAFFTNSIFIFLTRAFPTLANLVVLLYYSHNLPKTDYGIYQNFWIHLYVMYPLACAGIHVLVITYPKSQIITLARHISTRHFAYYMVWFAFVAFLFGLLEYHTPQLYVGFTISMLFFLSFAIGIMLEALMIVARKLKTIALLNSIYAAAFCIIHKLVLHDGYNAHRLFLYLMLLVVLKTLVYAALVYSSYLRGKKTPVDETLRVAEIRKLWIHLGIYDITQMVFGGIDKFAISLLLVPALSAIYFNGSQNIPFLPVLLSAAGNAVLLQLSHVSPADGKRELVKLMGQLGRILSAIVFPVFCFLLFFYRDLYHSFLPEYPQAAPVFLAAVFVLPIKAFSFTTPLQKLHRGDIINAGAIGDLVLALGLCYPMYTLYGLPGVALSFVISTWLQAAFYLWYAASLLSVHPLQLLPVKDWGVKFFCYGILFYTFHRIGAYWFTQRFPLILAIIGLCIATLGALIYELKYRNSRVIE